MKASNFRFYSACFCLLLAGLTGTQARAIEGAEWFGVNGSLLWGLGSYKSSSSTIQSRTMDTLSIEALPGYRWGNVLVGMLAEFRFAGQTTDPSTVNDSNVRGSGFLLGLGGAYSWNSFDFTGGVNFLGQYSQSNSDPMGNSIVNKKPFGFVGQVGYRVMPNVSADARFSMVSYGTDSVAGTDNDVSTDKRTHTDFALGLTYHL